MPYYIYRISFDMQLQRLDQHDTYRDARDRVRILRAEQQNEDRDKIRLIHASSELEAERLLLTPRETPIEGDD